jgi:hypothetical protein
MAYASVVHYEINENAYNKSYYPDDVIYPEYSAALKKICGPQEKGGLLNNKPIVGKMWSGHLVCSNLGGLLFLTLLEHGALTSFCVIMHNMIIEDERDKGIYDIE